MTAEERRTGILDSALAVFSESGYHSSSIDDIAREAGVSKALIYEHFASKQELYADLIARNSRELTQRIGAALVGGTQSMANWWTANPEAPREQMVAIAMDFAWLGLERLSRGERWPPE